VEEIMFFAKEGIYKPCGLFSLAHIIFLCFSIISITIGLHYSKKLSPNIVRKIIGYSGIVFIFLELMKIIFVLVNYGPTNYNSYIPLYFCSIFEFVAVLSGFCKGKLQKIGDSFVFFGGIIGGLVFLIYPSTTLNAYPWFHFLCFHSVLLHSTMVFSSLLIVMTKTYIPNKKDVIYYCIPVLVFTALAFIVNNICGSNLMFISHKFATIPLLSSLWDILGIYGYVVLITLAQTVGIFYVVYGIYCFVKKILEKKEKNNNCEVNSDKIVSRIDKENSADVNSQKK
jgi:hypothetical integral membrane protein (TIGR02206 family)